MNRNLLFGGINLFFALIIAFACAVGGAGTGRLIYLSALFAICSSPLLFARRLNDRYALLLLFSGYFFVQFGLLDVTQLLQGTVLGRQTEFPSLAETAILVGGLVAHIAYHIGCRLGADRRAAAPRDWSPATLVRLGTVTWLVTTTGSFYFKIFVIKAQTAETVSRGLASLSQLETMAFLLANLAQPLGILFLSYALYRFNRRSAMPLVVLAVVVQLLLGFIVDSKATALIGFVLVSIVYLLVNGTIPKKWVAVIGTLLLLAFPVMQANREVRASKGIDSVAALSRLVEVFEAAFKASDRVSEGPNRANTAFERMSLKGSVEMIVNGIADGHEYQGGYTLLPMLTAFIPRIIWADKLDVQTGQLLNKEFRVSDSEYTYISPSHLGELYWNFGMAGVLVGMSAFGLIIGFIGARFDCSRAATLTGVLVLVITIQFTILGAEGSIAVQYVQWMRALAIVALLHMIFARQRMTAPGTSQARRRDTVLKRYPNILTGP